MVYDCLEAHVYFLLFRLTYYFLLFRLTYCVWPPFT